MGSAGGGVSPAAEVDCNVNEIDWASTGRAALGGFNRTGEGGQGAARGDDGHVGGCSGEQPGG